MINFKLNCKETIEKIIFVLIITFVIVNGVYRNDSVQAIISAVCGITYTVLAGKGKTVCYLFGVTGSGFYSYLSFINALWGNLLLYAGYYIPMQILGFFSWKKNLKQDKDEIIKTCLSAKEVCLLIICVTLASIVLLNVLAYLKDAHPILDSITTVFSLAGMYLTVRRCIEQWLIWMIVNALSLTMWLNVASAGGKVWSTVIMWAVYLFLAVYFYIDWKKELSKKRGRV